MILIPAYINLMNILVTGANGQLGNELRILAKSIPAPNNTDCHTFLFTDISQAEGVETTFLDITDLDAIRKIVQDNHINAIINCAAWTNVDAAESNEETCELLNATAPENLAIAIKEAAAMQQSIYQYAPRSKPAADYMDVLQYMTTNRNI